MQFKNHLFLITTFITTTLLQTPPLINLKTYTEIINYVENLKKHKKIIKITDGFKKYPVSPILCGLKNCKFPIIELTNFENGTKNILKLPSILLISGFDGNKQNFKGINILINFLEKNKKNFFLLNNFRIIVILIANPYGVKNFVDFEIVKKKKIKILEDFSFYFNTNGCFNTKSAKIINYLFLSNIFFGVFHIKKGKFGLGYPFSNELHNNDENPDKKPFENISNFFFKNFQNENFQIGKIQNLEIGKRDNFIDWAYGASWDFLFFNRKCMVKSFGEFDGYPDQSNRAFGFNYYYGDDDEVEIIDKNNKLKNFTKNKDKNDEGEKNKKDKNNKNIQNDQKEKDKKENKKDISSTFKNTLNKQNNNLTPELFKKSNFIITQYFNFLLPSLELLSITKEKNHLKIKIKVKGCLNIHRLAIIQNVDYQKLNEIKNKNFESIFDFKIENVNNIPFSNLRLELNCENSWILFEKQIFPESHFLRQKFDPNYFVKYKDFFLENKNFLDFEIFNIDFYDVKKYEVITDPFFVMQVFKEIFLKIDFFDFFFF